jgi:hypothetical protein
MSMTDVSHLAEVVVPLAAILGSGLVAILIIAVVSWRKVRVAEMDAALKQQMLDRGMSADEIVRVLGASSPTGCRHSRHERMDV